MAAIESYQINETSGATVTITKPTGLSVGDALVAFIFQIGPDDTSPATPSGWTLLEGFNGEINTVGGSCLAKIAEASDVAASDFTFSRTENDDNVSGVLFRVSGVVPSFITDSSATRITNTKTPTYTGLSTEITTPESLVFAVVTNNNSAGLSDLTISPSDITFTKYWEQNSSHVYGGVRTETSTITTAAFTGSFGTDLADSTCVVLSIAAVLDASGTNTLTSTTSTTFAQAGTADGVIGNVLTETDTTMFAQNGKETAPTQWTNEAKPSTTWVNETK